MPIAQPFYGLRVGSSWPASTPLDPHNVRLRVSCKPAVLYTFGAATQNDPKLNTFQTTVE
jgi:hypothetical protein